MIFILQIDSYFYTVTLSYDCTICLNNINKIVHLLGQHYEPIIFPLYQISGETRKDFWIRLRGNTRSKRRVEENTPLFTTMKGSIKWKTLAMTCEK